MEVSRLHETEDLTHCKCGSGAFYIKGIKAFCAICDAEQPFAVLKIGARNPQNDLEFSFEDEYVTVKKG